LFPSLLSDSEFFKEGFLGSVFPEFLTAGFLESEFPEFLGAGFFPAGRRLLLLFLFLF